MTYRTHENLPSAQKRNMKIWHITKTLAGGAGQYPLRLNNALRAAGMKSTVLVAEGPVLPGTELLNLLDSPLRRFKARGFRSLSHRISLGPYHSLCGLEIYNAAQMIQAGDIVHLHGMTGWIGVAGLRRLIPPGAKVFWTAHDLWMLSGGCVVYRGCDNFRNDCSKCPILRPPWKGVAGRELRVKRAFAKTFEIRPIANSRWMAERIRESSLFHLAEPVPIIPPIVDAAYLANDIACLRRELSIAPDRKVICLGARSLDDKFKGIPEFLAQLSQTPTLADRLTVLLFGPGKIEIPANLDVRLLGNITEPAELAKVYRTSDVHVSPSFMETFGMTLVEAQACGTPVVAFDVGGVRDAVEDVNLLVPSHDFSQLLTILVSVIMNLPGLDKRRTERRDWVISQFEPRIIAERQLQVYRDPHS